MRRLRSWFLRLGGLFHKEQRDREFAAELESHLQLHVDENLRRGMSPAESRRQAILRLGGVEQSKEIYRDRRGLPMLETLFQDIRFGLRMLRKYPGFTTVAVLTLAIGIGATSAIFSVVDPLLIHPLPFQRMDQLVKVWESIPSRGVERNEVAQANYTDWRAQNDVFDHLGFYYWWTVNVSGIEVPERVQGFLVSPDLFPALGVNPVLGRWFLPEEEQPGKDREVILSYGYWQRRYGADPKIVGRVLTLNGLSRTVVGVMPPNFNFPTGGEMWAPYPMDLARAGARQAHSLLVVGRLKPGVTLERAANQLNTIAAQLEKQFPNTNTGRRVVVVPLVEDTVRDYRSALLVLLAAVGFLLLIACTNVANLMLLRAAARQKELAIRAALGAARTRVVRQLLTESLLLAILGGILGTVFAIGAVALLPRLFPAEFIHGIPGADILGVNLRALGFTFLLSMFTGTLFGLAPALQGSKPNVVGSLNERDAQGSGGVRRHHLRNALVVAEVSLALVLLIGTGLMARSLVRLLDVNPGFRTDHILTMRILLPFASYKDPQKPAAFFQQLLERVEALPGVQAAGAVNHLPLAGSNQTTGILIQGRPPLPTGAMNEVNFRSATPDYFRAMGVTLLAGRAFSAQDVSTAPPVAILNKAAAQHFFPNEEPVGKQVRFDEGNNTPWMTVVGVIGNVQHMLSAASKDEIYVPQAQDDSRAMALAVRTSGDPLALALAVRDQVLALDKNQPVYDIRTLEQVQMTSIFLQRVSATLLGVFAVVALFLAGVGIYGVMSNSVKQRTHEIGVHIALGAQPSNVLRLIIGRGLKLIIAGLVVGLLGAFALTQVLSTLLFNVKPTDPATFAGVSALLTVVALLACYLPARRATKVDPVIALRHE
jgi:putative ABC transport system permease protein